MNTFAEFGGYLYSGGENLADGAEVWRTSNGSTWTQVNTNGFGDPDNIHIGSLMVFDNKLFAGTRNDETGGQIWQSTNGTVWTQIVGNGFGNSSNQKIESLFVYDDKLFAVVNNYETGLEVWHSYDGINWTQYSGSGFGDSNNTSTLWNSATILLNGQLYIGTWNGANGGELWMYDPYLVYVPISIK
jgi:flagellin